MSFRIALIGATALAATAVAAAPAAQAQTTVLYGGGGTLAAKVYRDLFNCYTNTASRIWSESPGNSAVPDWSTAAGYPTTNAPTAGCTTPQTIAVEAPYLPVGSGAGLAAFTTGNPASWGLPASSNPVAYIDTTVTAPYDSNSVPYPEVDFAGSDAYLSAAQISAAAAIDGGRAIYQIPMLATPITLPVGFVSGEALTSANVCDIFSGQAKVPNNTQTHQEIYVRADGSGTSFIFSDWLANNCSGNGAQGKPYAFTSANGFPSTTPSWSNADVGTLGVFTKVSGSGGIAAAVSVYKYSIGYDSPDYVYPVVRIHAYPATVNSDAPTYANTLAHLEAVTYPSPYTNNIGSVINSELAAPTTTGYPIVGYTFVDAYGCYTGTTIRTAAQGNALKAFLTAYIVNSTFHTEASKILASRGFVQDPTALELVLKGQYGPLNAASGINDRCG